MSAISKPSYLFPLPKSGVYIIVLISALSSCAVRRAASTRLTFHPQTSSARAGDKPAQQAAEVDELMKEWSAGHSPGAAVLVIRDGKVLLKKGYGLANLSTGEAITPDTVFDLASVSKQFTAMGVMTLVQTGRLRLEDSLGKFFPSLPVHMQKITVKHLLQHTSGLTDYPNIFISTNKIDRRWNMGWQFNGFQPTSTETFQLIAAQPKLEFAPGEKWQYSNSNYVVLAHLIERVSGQTFRQFLKEKVFSPLGMNDTFVYDQSKPKAMRHALRYDRDAKGYNLITETPFDHIYGDGNVHTSLNDLFKWDQALYANKLVGAALLKEAFASGKLNNGQATGYGFGWNIGSYFNLNILSHEGGGTGFNSFIMRVPEERLTVVVLSNFARFNPYAIGRRIARIYLAGRLTLPVAAAAVAPEILNQYVGQYLMGAQARAHVALEGGALRARIANQSQITLRPLSGNRFFVEGDEETIITFHSDANGRVTGVTVAQAGDAALYGTKIKEPDTTP